MPIINFKEEFADSVRSGEKRQTIRRPRETPIKRGDKLCFYTGLRTKNCKWLREAICKDVQAITVIYLVCMGFIVLDRKLLGTEEALKLVKKDGFDCPKDFFQFFKRQYGLPFRGILIRW